MEYVVKMEKEIKEQNMGIIYELQWISTTITGWLKTFSRLSKIDYSRKRRQPRMRVVGYLVLAPW